MDSHNLLIPWDTDWKQLHRLDIIKLHTSNPTAQDLWLVDSEICSLFNQSESLELRLRLVIKLVSNLKLHLKLFDWLSWVQISDSTNQSSWSRVCGMRNVYNPHDSFCASCNEFRTTCNVSFINIIFWTVDELKKKMMDTIDVYNPNQYPTMNRNEQRKTMYLNDVSVR